MKRSLNIFYNKTDETEFSELLLKNFPEIAFIDGCYWPTPEPPLKESITACKENLVYLWNPHVIKTLPYEKHSDGARYHGPQSGIVIQYLRCRIDENNIRNGCISIGISDSDDIESIKMKKFVNDVWKIINKFSVPGLVCVSPDTGEIINDKIPQFRLGKHAAKWSLEHESHFLRDATVYNYYKANS
ncbi:MAG: hypothetical protein OEY52_10300 [Gammaproteobacteria bacterium]|nr:hypothetical protein [Gammaproteobacteria bacterium]